MKSEIKPGRTFYLLFLSGFVLIFLVFFHRPILIAAGTYLSPEGSETAEAVILEGCDLAIGKGMQVGMSLLSSGRAGRLIIIYHYPGNEGDSGTSPNYHFISRKIEQLGLKKDHILLIGTSDNHPITMTEAKTVLAYLSSSKVKSAILLAEGFHTRRSYWAYKQSGLPLDITIIPVPYFLLYGNHGYSTEDWWQRTGGIQAFFEEWSKLLYYLLRGYIPLKSLWVT
jgi:uncharacterized SAM-binding protein YcdF (DUF218 family)